ncbi:MAG: hypothetical protein U5Q44_02040 [Dehalococcoidia bacterium]|nr:hypothetical protein [Dehalococcoidia bacterium]
MVDAHQCVGRIEHSARQNLAIGGHNDKVRPVAAETLLRLGILVEGFGLIDIDAVRFGEHLHGRRTKAGTAACRAVGLGDGEHDVVFGAEQRAERRIGELGRAHEDDANVVDVHYSFDLSGSGRSGSTPEVNINEP